MKTSTINSLLTATLVAMVVAGSALAYPPGKGAVHKRLATEDDFKSLKTGEQVALVCKQCDTVTTTEVEDDAQKMEMCRKGAVIHCPECKMDYKVVRKGHPAGKGGTPGLKKEVVIVNSKGEPCMFYVKTN